ncbi:MAG: hypothetical protein U0228_12910 [Myxococcaceae bacterium]
MFAARHAVFIGPGKVPDELRDVLSKRVGSLHPDIAIQVPRLLAIFESASDAERIANQVQRLRLGALVAGPEQPPSELSWTVGRELHLESPWRVLANTGETVTFNPGDVTAITVLDWRPDEGAADRAVLFTLREQRPVMLRASALDTVSRHSIPMEGLKKLNDVLDAAATFLDPAVKVRSRKLNEADFRGEGQLTGDLLPLVLAIVDGVDTAPGELSRPLQGKKPDALPRAPHHTDTAALCAWALYLISLPALVLSLGYLTIAALSIGFIAVCAGTFIFAWGTRRFMWSRWLAHANWGPRPPVPSWPINPEEPGIQPRPLELGLDALVLFLVSLALLLGDGLLRTLSLWSLPFVLLAVLVSTVSVYEAWQRE